jgi:hypothetical protein
MVFEFVQYIDKLLANVKQTTQMCNTNESALLASAKLR